MLRGYPTVRWRAWLEIPEVKTRPVLNCRLESVVVDNTNHPVYAPGGHIVHGKLKVRCRHHGYFFRFTIPPHKRVLRKPGHRTPANSRSCFRIAVPELSSEPSNLEHRAIIPRCTLYRQGRG